MATRWVCDVQLVPCALFPIVFQKDQKKVIAGRFNNLGGCLWGFFVAFDTFTV